jgi:hypothetical protein
MGPGLMLAGVQPRLHDEGRQGSDADRWVLLAYRVPRTPSTPRIAIWRRLKQLGVGQLLDGLVALPLDSRTREALEWVADDVEAAGGEAHVWVAAPASLAEEHALAARMAAAVAVEYESLAAEAAAAEELDPRTRRRTLARLRRQLHRIRRRDYFPPAKRELAEAAVQQLAATLEEAVVR